MQQTLGLTSAFFFQQHNKFHFISDKGLSYWLAKTSNKQISLTTWLALNPNS